jgi:hypothetical protein
MEPEQNKSDVLMRYQGGDKAVLSGLMNGADEIKGRAAVVKTAVGQGEVVMFTTNPIWRWQNIGEFRMMFNTILNYKSLNIQPPAQTPAEAPPAAPAKAM